MTAILDVVEQSEQGLTLPDLEAKVNLDRTTDRPRSENLGSGEPAPLARLEGRWVATLHRYDPRQAFSARRALDAFTSGGAKADGRLFGSKAA